MAKVEDQLSQAFVCQKCGQHGARVERLSISGTGISRLLEVQPYLYCFVTCKQCGFTEVYDLRVLEGNDDVGTLLDVLFAN